jgi:rhodanese-related sulfurtransferase
VPGAINIPHTELEQRLDELGQWRDAEIVVYCGTGRRAAMAESVLLEADFSRVRDLEGHMKQWRADGHPLQP